MIYGLMIIPHPHSPEHSKLANRIFPETPAGISETLSRKLKRVLFVFRIEIDRQISCDQHQAAQDEHHIATMNTRAPPTEDPTNTNPVTMVICPHLLNTMMRTYTHTKSPPPAAKSPLGPKSSYTNICRSSSKDRPPTNKSTAPTRSTRSAPRRSGGFGLPYQNLNYLI